MIKNLQSKISDWNRFLFAKIIRLNKETPVGFVILLMQTDNTLCAYCKELLKCFESFD